MSKFSAIPPRLPAPRFFRPLSVQNSDTFFVRARQVFAAQWASPSKIHCARKKSLNGSGAGPRTPVCQRLTYPHRQSGAGHVRLSLDGGHLATAPACRLPGEFDAVPPQGVGECLRQRGLRGEARGRLDESTSPPRRRTGCAISKPTGPPPNTSSSQLIRNWPRSRRRKALSILWMRFERLSLKLRRVVEQS
jgi:hypothetical protein